MPVFPLLAGLPHRPLPPWLAVLILLLPALLAGWAVLRAVPAGRGWTGRLTDCAAAAVLAGTALAVLAGLAAGDLGPGTLRGIGAHWWAVGAGATVLVLLGAACWLGVEAVRGRLAHPGASLYTLPAKAKAKAKAEAEAEPAARTEETGALAHRQLATAGWRNSRLARPPAEQPSAAAQLGWAP